MQGNQLREDTITSFAKMEAKMEERVEKMKVQMKEEIEAKLEEKEAELREELASKEAMGKAMTLGLRHLPYLAFCAFQGLWSSASSTISYSKFLTDFTTADRPGASRVVGVRASPQGK